MKIITDNKTLSDLNNWADTLIKRIQVEMENQGINASGNLSNSLEYRITDKSDGTHIQVLAAPYFVYAENGREAGKIPSNFIDILKQWIADKGLDKSDEEDRQFACSIAYKIMNKGSQRHREHKEVDVITPALDETRPKLNEILETSVVVYINDLLFGQRFWIS